MKFISSIIILQVFTLSLIAQVSTREIKANKMFERFSYSKAIEKYEQIENLSIEGKRNLALSYLYTNKYISSKKAFDKFINTSDATAEDYFIYASVLRMNGNYEESLNWLNKFKSIKPDDNRSKLYASSYNNLPTLHKDDGRYKIEHLSINSSEQEFGPSYYLNKIVFTSSKEGVKSIKRAYNRNEKPFLNIYVADKKSESLELENQKPFRKELNKFLHEGPASFNAEGTFMAYTRNNYKEKSTDGAVKLEIYFSKKNEKGEWVNEDPFKLNNKEYNVGQPCLSSDGNTMFFSSDMPGGFGRADIYRISKNSEGLWGDAINLGPLVNSESDEMFPFFQEELGILFFSSNGHIGLGGLDIYLSPQNKDKSFTKIINAGAPLNTRFDDFALIIDNKMQKGYFSSNREGGKGDDDIYSFELLKPFIFGKTIKGIAKDKKNIPLSNAIINLEDENGNIIESVKSDENGAYSFNVQPDKKYKVIGVKNEYFDGITNVNTNIKDEIIYADVVLEKDPGLSLYFLITDKKSGNVLPDVKLTITNNTNGEQNVIITPSTGDYLKPLITNKLNDKVSYTIKLEREGYFAKTLKYTEVLEQPGKYLVHSKMDLSMDIEVKDLSEMIQINPINFDLNKFNIRPDAAKELDKIVEIMNKYPDMIVELGSHTDCRASMAYNLQLSDKRAKASAAYIKSKITKPERIYGKGYGESRLLNDCACEGNVTSNCSEEEHTVNRRTEFKVISTGNDKLKVTNKSTNSFDK